MKNKLMLSILSTIILSLAMVTALYMTIINYQNEENIKKSLEINNKLVMNLLEENVISDKSIYFKNFNRSNFRVTLIDTKGKVIYDSDALPDEMDNHNQRKEIIEARKFGNGYSVRFSKSLKKTMMYYASALKDGYVIRSSMPMEVVTGFEGKYLKYYLIVLIIVFSISVIFSSKLSYVIVKPIKDLEFITARIAKGEFDRRVCINSNDEIGQLAETFNNMADKLQYTLRDSIEKQNKLQAILKSMDSGVIAVDRKNRVIIINPYAQKIFGVEKEIIGHNLMDCIRDYELEDIFKNNIEYKEIKILWPEEKILKVRTADIVSNKEHIGTVAVVQDVTDIRRLENMRSQFVANVSHELKTPLTSIKGFAETLRYVEDVKIREKFLGIIDNETERLTRLISDILTLSDIEQNREVKVKEVINVNSVIKDAYNLMKNTADMKEIDIELIIKNSPKICGDKDRFKQMLINLIDNAIKYSENGDKVYIGTEIKEKKCILWIEDTGPGIPKEHIPRLFERFYRVDKARSRARGGTGLGLAIVKHIVLNFEGEIYVESELGSGTKFIVEIPLLR
ncbi:two-component system histidine kinase PnpS [Clostridium sp. ZS2-4]|uniref:two-component system histidine kinase PnpS n=1 Tax=Clostridium sp. ZS2-4 TaxID=2987703 RepID=UPI00227B9643|nr:ATP-binding protein [Clostridium sp. ZS2-4]MCY6356753.1 ATP-binding protein [Clostridium sp. ZS2-4]